MISILRIVSNHAALLHLSIFVCCDHVNMNLSLFVFFKNWPEGLLELTLVQRILHTHY
jgi:hypothetical protein